MSRTITLIATAVATLLAAASVSAQGNGPVAASAGMTPDSQGCTYNFGSGNLIWCVNEHGNLQRFASPSGEEHIQVGNWLEGYSVCVNGDAATYYDLAWSEAGFGAPVLIAQSASSVTIKRTTTDGKFVLTQKWTRDTAERDLTVQMTLQNLGPQANVTLVRAVDVDANNDFPDDYWDKSRYGGWIRDIDAVSVTGLTLVPAPSAVIQNPANLLATCAPTATASPGGPGDPAAYVIYNLGSMKTLAKKIVKVGIRAQ